MAGTVTCRNNRLTSMWQHKTGRCLPQRQMTKTTKTDQKGQSYQQYKDIDIGRRDAKISVCYKRTPFLSGFIAYIFLQALTPMQEFPTNTVKLH